MEKKRSFGLFLLLLLFVLSSQGMMVATEARECESRSHKFKGLCFAHHNCANVCKSEGFSGGDCKGLRHRCICTRRC